MRSFLAIATIGAAACLTSHAQELSHTWIELPVSTLKTSDPEGLVDLSKGDVTVTNGQNEISTTVSQPARLEYSLTDQFPLFFRYQGEVRLQTIEDPLTNFNLGNHMDISHTTALVAEFSKTFTATLLLENRNLLPQDAMLQWKNRAEVIAKKIQLFGKVDFTTTVGAAQTSDASGATVSQRYVRVQMDKKLPNTPIRLRLAPSLTEETYATAAQGGRLLTGLDTAILYDANEQTTFSVGALYASSEGFSLDESTSQRSVYTQVEHKPTTTSAIRLRAGYDEGTVRQVINATAMAFMLDTSFSLTHTLRGGMQLQHHVRELLSGSDSLPETVLSFSLGGSF